MNADPLLDAIDRIPEQLLVVGADGRIEAANQDAADLLGRTRLELVGQAVAELVVLPTVGPDGLIEALRRDGGGRGHVLHRGGMAMRCAVRARADGERLVLSLGRPAEEPVRGADQALYRLLFDRSPMGLYHWDRDGVIIAVNDVFCEIVGAPRHVLVGLRTTDLPDQRVAALIAGTLRGEPGVFEGVYTSITGGRTAPVRTVFTPMVSEEGEILGGLGIVEDVSEERALQGRLVEAERLASIGTLAAGLAHEINNPLTVILGAIELAGVRGPPDPQTATMLRTCESAANQMHAVIRDLLAFARSHDRGVNHVALDLVEVITAATRLAGVQVRRRGRLILELDPTPRVRGSPRELQQVALNLLLNAAQALPEGGRRGAVRVRTWSREGQVYLQVADNGCGMTPEVLHRVFEPFFTTKGDSGGTGLGLPVCHGIARAHGGELTATSEEGVGSTFTLRLPAAP